MIVLLLWYLGPAAHSTPMPRDRHVPAERDEQRIAQPRFDEHSEYEVQSAPGALVPDREQPAAAPRKHTAPQPVSQILLASCD